MQKSNQIASSSLTYGCTKHSNRLQPTRVTIHRGRGFCRRLYRCRGQQAEFLALLVPTTRLPEGRNVPPSRLPAQPPGTQGSKMLVQWSGAGGRNTRHGQGARSSTFKEPFTPIYFYTRWLKKKKKRSPCCLFIQKSGIAIGFGWVIDFKSQQHMLFPLPSHSLPSQPPLAKETNK